MLCKRFYHTFCIQKTEIYSDYFGMGKIKVLFAIFTGTLVYALVSFIAGDNGILGYNQLLEQKKNIARQTEVIQNINNELNLEYSALLRDRDVIAAYARKLDYVGNGEKLVKVNGLKPHQTALYDIGSVLRKKSYCCLSERTCKITGFVFFLLTLSFMLLIDLNNGNITLGHKDTAVIKGIPVYDIEQI